MIRLEIFYGQGENVRALIASVRSDTLPHACIVSGAAGSGRRTLVRLICKALYCANFGQEDLTGIRTEPCETCPACLQIEADTYPYVTTLALDKPLVPDAKKDRKTISIDDVREVIRLCGQLSGDKGRVVIIEKAETMTPQAQNTLLKTLEEPPEGTHFFLITERPENLLTTIVSRCTRVHLQPWPDDYLKKILLADGIPEARAAETILYAGGSIGKARQLALNEEYWKYRSEVIEKAFNITQRSDIFSTATSMKDNKAQFESFCDTLESLLMTLLYVRNGQLPETAAKEFPDPWKNFSKNAPVENFDNIFRALSECREMRFFNVNIQAIIENLLLLLMEEQTKWRKS